MNEDLSRYRVGLDDQIEDVDSTSRSCTSVRAPTARRGRRADRREGTALRLVDFDFDFDFDFERGVIHVSRSLSP